MMPSRLRKSALLTRTNGIVAVALTMAMTSTSIGAGEASSGQGAGTSQETAVASPASTPGLDVCALLPEGRVKAVFGEEVTDTRKISEFENGLEISQCYFVLATPGNYINLRVVRKGEGDRARNPREVWQESFDATNLEKAAQSRRRPQPIKDLGDAAFWMGDAKTGALYILKGNSYVRIALGQSGGEAISSRIKKASELGREILKGL